jgi:superfamily I DNA/RNA helicase
MEYKASVVEDQVETLLTLIEATKDSGGQFVTDLIDLVNKMFGDTPEGEMPKCTILATVHKSKGREWPRVFILGRSKFMPSKWAVKKWEMEQEDNLQYVAVTRAKETLVEIVVPD